MLHVCPCPLTRIARIADNACISPGAPRSSDTSSPCSQNNLLRCIFTSPFPNSCVSIIAKARHRRTFSLSRVGSSSLGLSFVSISRERQDRTQTQAFIHSVVRIQLTHACSGPSVNGFLPQMVSTSFRPAEVELGTPLHFRNTPSACSYQVPCLLRGKCYKASHAMCSLAPPRLN
jgi:hypothetical protein